MAKAKKTKTPKAVEYGFRFEFDLYTAIKAEAERNTRSIAQEIHHRLKATLAKGAAT